MEQATATSVVDEALRSLDIEVAGRRFKNSTATTFEQDMYVMQLLEETGLQKLAQDFNVLEQDISEISSKVIIQAFASGKLFHLLAGTLEEVGVPWTVKNAQVNGEFFSKLTDPKDKDALKGSLVAVILSFFVSGLLSSKTSPISSLVNLEMQPESTGPSDE